MKKLKKVLLIVIFLIGIQTTVKAAENSIYEIEWTQDNSKAVDISAAETKSGANVQIWDKCNGGQQRFELIYLNDGYYTIKNVNSGKVIDVKGAGKKAGTNVWQWESNLTDAQKWKLEKNTDGSYSIISKCNGLYLNVTGIKNGSNIEVNTQKQSFNLKKITAVKGSKTITDGYYTISTAIDESKVLDISAASKIAGANVQIWVNEHVSQQKFYIKYDGNGYYTIKNLNSGKMLDVAKGKTEKGTNVWQWTSNFTDAQKWVIKKTEDGYYNIISKLAGINLEVANGKNINGTNIQINMPTNAKNQKFIFNEAKVGTKTIANGTYEIVAKIASNMILDVSGGATNDGTNVQIWADANEFQQKFEATYIGNGNYKIICKKSGKALTVSETGTEYSSNVFQSTYKETSNQLWRIERKKDTEYYIVSEYNGRYLDVAGGSKENGANIRVYVPNFSDSQTFIFEQRKYGIDVSHWQNTIDFNALSNSKKLDFIIIRAGQGTTIKDRQFERNYIETKKYKIPTGVYLYAKAQSIEEAKLEAKYLVELLKGKNFELPIFYDVEEHENLDKNLITQMCLEFCKILKNAGYKTGIYASKYYLLYKLNPSSLPTDCSIWVASYGKNNGTIPQDTYKYNGKHDIWQYTSTGKISGIIGDVDYNMSYKFP